MTQTSPVAALRPVLGDQLSLTLPSLADLDPARDVVLLMEVAEETTYAPHHRKKIALILSAMRHFAADLTARGVRVDYVRLDDPANTGSFTGELTRAVSRHAPARVIATEAAEWRVLTAQRAWSEALGLPVLLREDTRFLASNARFAAWAEGRKQWRMEYFYREMRREHAILMEGDQPTGGQWNFDHDNRKPAKDAGFLRCEPLRFEPDTITSEVLELVARRFADGWGDLQPFWFGVSRADAEAAADHFFAHGLAGFGDTQDAMLTVDKWLSHSVLALYLNIGLLDPLDLCRRAEAAYHKGRAPLNATEGYIRQILGWREFVRGVYWARMPGYASVNALNADRPLPEFYWSGETDLACIKACVTQTREEAYAHHIQRLMVTGNFAMLAGVAPHAVHEWYLGVYADAFEWVEMPNVLGMSQFADGGVLGSKPYAASGAYIDRMSDYCGSCRYDVKAKVGPNACPFNLLYWGFLDRHRERLSGNPRMAQMYRTWDKMDAAHRARVLAEAAAVRDRLVPPATPLPG